MMYLAERTDTERVRIAVAELVVEHAPGLRVLRRPIHPIRAGWRHVALIAFQGLEAAVDIKAIDVLRSALWGA